MTTTNVRFDLKKAKEQTAKPPPRMVVFGDPGVGKSTFGASAPGAVFVPTEDGALGLDVPRLPTDGKCATWDDLLTALQTLRDQPHDFKWAIVDTLNGAEHLCAAHVCSRDFGGNWNTKKGVEGFSSFGKGDRATAQELRAMLSVLDELQQKRHMGVILLAHVGLHRSANALGPDFQKFGADMSRAGWSLVCGWSDQVAFATREFRVSTRDGEIKPKANETTKERYLIFEGGPGLDAKGRAGYDMPDRILLSWEEYESALRRDNLGELVSFVGKLIEDAPKDTKDLIQKKLPGGKITTDAIRGLGKEKIKATINWLESRKATQQQANA